MKTTLACTLVAALLAVSAAARQLQTPTDWQWRTDTPAKVTADAKLGPDSWHFVAMPPGWHVTMGPGGLLYPDGRDIAKIPRAGLSTDGAFGLRVGKDLNMHISTLDVTQRLAPDPRLDAKPSRPSGASGCAPSS